MAFTAADLSRNNGADLHRCGVWVGLGLSVWGRKGSRGEFPPALVATLVVPRLCKIPLKSQSVPCFSVALTRECKAFSQVHIQAPRYQHA